MKKLPLLVVSHDAIQMIMIFFSFNHFYGPPKGSEDDNKSKPEESWIPHPTGETEDGIASCSKHSACVALELTGDCCPTSGKKGIMLDCCGK